MKAITIKELAKDANDLIAAGYGDRKILLTDDDEGNGTHECFQLFSELTEDSMMPLPYGVSEEEAIKNYLVLG